MLQTYQIAPPRRHFHSKALLSAAAIACLLCTAGFWMGSPVARGLGSELKEQERFEVRSATGRIPGLRGGGQVTACLNPRNAHGQDDIEEEMKPAHEFNTGKIGFFSEIGKGANNLLKFASGSKVNLNLKTAQKGLTLSTSALRNLFTKSPASDDGLSLKGEGSSGSLGYWFGADNKNNLEGGLAYKATVPGDGKLDTFLSLKLPKAESVEAETVYTSPKFSASLRAPKLSASGIGPLESSMSYGLTDQLKIAGAVGFLPDSVTLDTLKANSALGAQYTADKFTISASTEGFGKKNKASVSSAIGDKDLAVSASMNGMGEDPIATAAISTDISNGILAKAGVSTKGDVQVEMSKKVYSNVALKVGAKTNLHSLSQPKFGAQIGIDSEL
eukprot:CAMPEP_0197533176 /NCGR_PEP_ID=MMETSP1318-20131121/42519_1 /TAXON_ID=552666 /ORGANISM="Partenskyella glossopodia, Strain RCC365" /LENGTH=387 /DNA_ID=CAMNT_0043089981 /DNA_START=43 /DNA_END=1206 /DNA_ORIENTATION=+